MAIVYVVVCFSELFSYNINLEDAIILCILMIAVMLFPLIPPVPIIDSVSAMALSLFAFWVNYTLLTDGGQNVTLYTVSVHVCVEV